MAAVPPDARASRARVLLAGLAGAFLLLTVYGWFIPEPGPNELSRVDLTFALVRQRTTSIEAYAHNTIDRAQYGGRYYSDKPLGLSLLAAPVLVTLDRALDLGDIGQVRVSYVAHLLTLVTVALPAALLAPLVAWTAVRLGAAPFGAIAAATAVALGTALMPFATTFYAHDTSAALGFAAFALVSGAFWRGRPGLAAALGGFCAGLAALVEYPVILVGATLFGWQLLRRAPPRRLLLYLGGGAVALAPLPLYNWVSFGAPWRLGYGFVSQEAFGGMTSGFFGLAGPTLAALNEVTLGPAGLLTQSPWIALALAGYWLWTRRVAHLIPTDPRVIPSAERNLGRDGGHQPQSSSPRSRSLFAALIGMTEGGRSCGRRPALAPPAVRGAPLCCLAVVGLFLLYNASYYLPMGGQSSGPRFLIPTLPFLALGLAFLPELAWFVVGPLAVASAAQMLAIAAVEPKAGPGVPDAFWSYWLPRLQAGDVAQTWGELRFGLRGADVLRPLAIPVAVGLVGGLLALVPPLRRCTWPAALFLGASLLTWLVLAAPIATHGVPDRFQLRAAMAPGPASVVYGDDVELVGYSVPEQAHPGDWLDVVLFWRARAPVRENLTGFVHAVGREGANLAGYDGPPVGAGFPTNLWRPGEVLRAPYRLHLNPAAAAPSALGIVAGFYGPGGSGLVPARDAQGRPIDPGPVVARLALRAPATPDAGPARASFEGGLDLLDSTLPTPTYPGGSATGTLRWRARVHPTRDATVFVQVVGNGRLVGQWDAQPLRGAYPTSLWPVGEVVEDTYVLTIRPDAPPGDYPIIAGLYLLPEVRRLAVGGSDHVELGMLRVER